MADDEEFELVGTEETNEARDPRVHISTLSRACRAFFERRTLSCLSLSLSQVVVEAEEEAAVTLRDVSNEEEARVEEETPEEPAPGAVAPPAARPQRAPLLLAGLARGQRLFAGGVRAKLSSSERRRRGE